MRQSRARAPALTPAASLATCAHRCSPPVLLWLCFHGLLVQQQASATEPEWSCSADANWVSGLSYSQTVIDSDSTPSVMTYDEAIARCKELCTATCTGFFYQQHTNTHQICGFFDADLSGGERQQQAHLEGAVCELVVRGQANGPDCTVPSNSDSLPWCACVAAQSAALGADISSYYDNWGDGVCDAMLNSETCSLDNGDCATVLPSASICQTQLQDYVMPYCCEPPGAPCRQMATECTNSCANNIIAFWRNCSWERSLGDTQPWWVWEALNDKCSATLASQVSRCADGQQYSALNTCDQKCDCPMTTCDDEKAAINNCPSFGQIACGSDGGAWTGDTTQCQCNNGDRISESFLCDGSYDCPMGEDEDSLACAKAGKTSITAFGTIVPVIGAKVDCIERWQADVEPLCGGVPSGTISFLGIVPSAGTFSFSADCAENYVSWFLDCRQNVFDDLGSQLQAAAAQIFKCAWSKHSSGGAGDATCTGSGPTTTACTGTAEWPIERVGDGTCDIGEPNFNCDAFADDGGDCDQAVLVAVPYTAVGGFTARQIASAAAAQSPVFTPGDIRVTSLIQTVEGAFFISGQATVYAGFFETYAATAQLQNGVAGWAGVDAQHVTSLSFADESSTLLNTVRVDYRIESPKDISVIFSPIANPTTLASAINGAGTVIETLSADMVSFEAGEQISMVFTLEVTVSELEYEKETATAIDDADVQSVVGTSVRLTLEDIAPIKTSLNTLCRADAGMTNMTCVNALTVLSDQIATVGLYPSGDNFTVITSIDKDTVSDVITTVVIVSIIVAVLCIVLCSTACYYCLKKQKNRVIVVNRAGQVIQEFEKEASDLDRKALMMLLESFINENEAKMRQQQQKELDDAAKLVNGQSSGGGDGGGQGSGDGKSADPKKKVAAIAAEKARLTENLDVPPPDLIGAYEKDISVAEARREKARKQAEKRLAARRTAIIQKQIDALTAEGVPPVVAEHIVAENDEENKAADEERRKLQAEVDEEEKNLTMAKAQEFADKMAAAKTEEEKRDLKAEYDAALASEKARLAEEGKSKRSKLEERLAARKALLAETHAQEAATCVADEDAPPDEKQMVEDKEAQLAQNLAACTTAEQRAQVLAQYEADINAEKSRLAAGRGEAEDQLAARLAARRAKIAEVITDQKEELQRVEDDAQQEHEELESENGIMDAFKTDHEVLKAAADAKKAKMAERLAARRAEMQEKHKAELEAAGVKKEEVEAQINEIKQLESIEDKQRQMQEAQLAKKEAAELEAQQAAMAAEMAAANDEEERKAVAENYQKQVEATKAKLAEEKKGKRGRLNERLAARKAALADKHASQLKDNDKAASVLADQQSEREQLDAAAAASSLTKAEFEAEQADFEKQLEEEMASHQKQLEELQTKHKEQQEAQEAKFAELKQQFDELAAQQSMPGAVEENDAAMTDEVMVQYQASLKSTHKKMEKQSGENKEKLRARMEARKQAMALKAKKAKELMEGSGK